MRRAAAPYANEIWHVQALAHAHVRSLWWCAQGGRPLPLLTAGQLHTRNHGGNAQRATLVTSPQAHCSYAETPDGSTIQVYPSIIGACAASVSYWLLYTAVTVLHHPGALGSSLPTALSSLLRHEAIVLRYAFLPLAIVASVLLTAASSLKRAAECRTLLIWMVVDGFCGMLLNAVLQGTSFSFGGSEDSQPPSLTVS